MMPVSTATATATGETRPTCVWEGEGVVRLESFGIG